LEDVGCCGRRHQGHHDHHREQRRSDDSEVEADVQDDQFHKPSGIHQCAERGHVAPTPPGQPGSDERTAELADGMPIASVVNAAWRTARKVPEICGMW